MYTHIIFFVGIVLLMGGCTSLDIKDIEGLSPVDMLRAELAPTKAQVVSVATKPKVVVDKFREPSDHRVRELSSLANLANVLTGTTEKYLTQAGIELVSRSEAQNLLGEVKLAEQQGKVGGSGGYQGLQVAEYVIVGRIDSVDTSAKFQEAYEYQDKEGKRVRIPPKCKYRADVTGKLHIYTVPQLRVAKSVNVRGNANKTEDSRGRCDKNPTSSTSIIREAGEDAVEGARIEFQNFFAPKGYVIEMRSSKDGKQYFIKVTIGKKRGLKRGEAVEIFTKTLQKNPLTEEVAEEERKITTGKVTNQVGESYAWIILDEPELAKRIKIGDYIKMKFKGNSLSDMLRKGLDAIKNTLQ